MGCAGDGELSVCREGPAPASCQPNSHSVWHVTFVHVHACYLCTLVAGSFGPLSLTFGSAYPLALLTTWSPMLLFGVLSATVGWAEGEIVVSGFLPAVSGQ